MADINVYYRKNEQYKTLPISGVWGGITPQGFIHGDLIIEKTEMPDKVVLQINDKTGEANQISQSPEGGVIIREALVGIVMFPEVAREIGKWLVQKADEFDNLSKKLK